MNSGQCLKYLKVNLYQKYWYVVTIKKLWVTQMKLKQMGISPNTSFNYILENVYWEMREMLNWLIQNCLTHLRHGTDNFIVSSHGCLLGNLLTHKSVAILLHSILSFWPHIAGSTILKSPSLLRLCCWGVIFKKLFQHISHEHSASWRGCWFVIVLVLSLYIKQIKRSSCQVDSGSHHDFLPW